MEQEINEPCTHCEHPFTGRFCPNCGQSVKVYERPFLSIIKEFLGDLFAFDSRFWRSLPALIYKPGTMISEYVGGKHVMYVPPFRLYVFVSFIFFLLLDNIAVTGVMAKKDDIINAISRDTTEMAGIGQPSIDSLSSGHLPEGSSGLKESPGSVEININSDDDKAKFREIIADPAKYITRFNKNISWSLFLLMPLLGFFFWLFFRKNRPYYVPHFLYALQLHTILFLVLSIIMGLQLALPDRSFIPETWLLYLLPVHAVVGARQLFRFGWISTFFRLAFATFMYMILIVTAAVLSALTIFTS
jgi:hypothetical protein